MSYKKVVLIIFLVGLIFILKDIYKEDNIRLVERKKENSSNIVNYLKNNNSTNMEMFLDTKFENTIKYTKVIKQNTDYELPSKYMGFEVDCKLEIPKIDLNIYVFKDYSEAAMNISATKLWGPNPNEYGNYSIIGHNYQKENMFNNLIELEINDKIYLTDNKNGKIEYIVYDIYKVKENNVDPIKQDDLNIREITLITCVNYTNNRLIIKAQCKK